MSDAMKQHGAFSWNELVTGDVEAAKGFYQQLFGWEFEEFNAAGMPYTVAKVGDKEVAGMMATPAGSDSMPPQWGAYVTVDDVDASAAKVEALGGKILVPIEDIPDIGRYCVVQDPQGAILSLMTYAAEQG